MTRQQALDKAESEVRRTIAEHDLWDVDIEAAVEEARRATARVWDHWDELPSNGSVATH